MVFEHTCMLCLCISLFAVGIKGASKNEPTCIIVTRILVMCRLGSIGLEENKCVYYYYLFITSFLDGACRGAFEGPEETQST